MRRAFWIALTIALTALPLRAQEHGAHPPAHGESEAWEPEAPEPPTVELEALPPAVRLRARVDYLYWWFKDMPLPPVFTTGLTTDALPGALGMPGTKVLFGGLTVDTGNEAGVRTALAYWFGPSAVCGVEVAGFYLAPRDRTVEQFSTGAPLTPVLSQPFLNAVSGLEDISILAAPGRAAGGLHAEVSARIGSAEANGLLNLYQWRGLTIDALAGFRWFQLHECLELRAQSVGAAGLPLIGGVSTAGIDRFQMDNDFYGGQLGLRGELRSGRFFVALQAKLALGVTQQALDISGQTTLQAPGQPPQTFVGGLYALSSNIGSYRTSDFAVLPEGNVELGWQPFDHLQFRLGYSFLYLSHAARAGAQVDRRLNPNLIPGSLSFGTPGGPALPTATPIHDADFWLQGFNVGMEIVF